MNIRKAKISDIQNIEAIYADARQLMRDAGNPTQWGYAYPPREQVIRDISEECLYLAEDGGEILAVFYFGDGPDGCYDEIEGEWLNA